MDTYRNFGFSLIELLVVIAIIGLLTAVSVSVYQNYILRAKIDSNVQMVARIFDDIQVVYAETGSFPSTITFNGQTVGGADWASVSSGDIIGMFYIPSPDGLGATIAVNFTGLGAIPGSVVPTAAQPTDNNYSFLTYGVRDINNSLQYECGFYDAAIATQEIPLTYLPNSCQCQYVANFANSGTPC